MTFKSLLTHSIYLRTRASSQNSWGEWTFTYTTATTATKCRLSPISASERLDSTGKYDNVKYKCFTEEDVSIDRDQEISDGTNSYRVKETITDSSSHHKTSLLILI